MKLNLSQALNDISSKIDDLRSRCNSLRTEINTELMDASVHNSVSEPSSISALNIVNELADREQRKKNLIVYNFPESNDHAADKTAFLKLYSTIFHLDANITKIFHLGKKNDGKHRPLLIGLEHEENKSSILSSSYKLCNHDQYKHVYIVADKTKFERDKHKRLVDELKQRRADGETNMIIRNGSIITRPQHFTSRPPSSGSHDKSDSS